MKVRKSKKKNDFIDRVIESKELSYDDYLKLKKLEELYVKAQNKYVLKNIPKNSSIKKIQHTLDSNKDDFGEELFDNYADFIPKNSPSYNRVKEFALYMDNTLNKVIY